MFAIRAVLIMLLGITVPAAAQSLTGANGASVTLGDVVGQGRWVMINVWSPGCSHCVTELPTLVRFHADNPAGAELLGLAVDYPGFGAADPAALATFADENGINFPLIATDGSAASRFLGETVDLVPVTYAYDPDGRLVARWHGVITRADLLDIIREFSEPVP